MVNRNLRIASGASRYYPWYWLFNSQTFCSVTDAIANDDKSSILNYLMANRCLHIGFLLYACCHVFIVKYKADTT